MRRRMVPLIGIVIAAAGISAGCSASSSSSQQSTTSASGASTSQDLSQPVTIGVGAKVGSYMLPFLAASQHLFQAQGLTNVHVLNVPGPQLPDSLAGGSVDVGVLGAPAADLAAINGPIKVIGTWQTNPGVQLVAGPGIKSVADLKGKKIAINGGKAGLASFMVQYALQQAGLSESDVNLVVLSDYPSQLQAYRSGQADATISAPPFTSELLTERPGSTVLRQFSQFAFPTPELAVNASWAQGHSAELQALARALEAARAMWLKEPSAAEAVLASQLDAAANSPTVTSTYQSTVGTFLPKLTPVGLSVEEGIFTLARSLGFQTATNSAAADVIAPAYVTDGLAGQ